MADEKEIPMREYVKELLAVQDRCYRNMVQMFVDGFNSELKSLKQEVNDLKLSLQFSQKELDEAKSKIGSLEANTNINSSSIDQVNCGLIDLDAKTDYLENQSRRNNVVIYGIPEEVGETWNSCENKVKHEIAEKLEIKDELLIERAHRVGVKGRDQKRPRINGNGGRRQNDQPRPIVAKFLNWKQKSTVVRAAQKKRPKGVMFKDDLSEKVLEKRSQLIPRMLEARKKGKIAYLVMDKLIVKEQTFNSRAPNNDEKDTTRNTENDQKTRPSKVDDEDAARNTENNEDSEISFSSF